MKKLLLLALLSLSVNAADLSTNVAANTVTSLSNKKWVITKVAYTTGGAAANVFFYDTATATTNITTSGYTSTISFQTNFTAVATNTYSGTKVTNNFTGTWSQDLVVAGGTAEAPKIATLSVLANGRQEKDVNLTTIRGLTILATGAGTVEVQFRPLY
ncbi:MAG TPA: hypothetical protein VL854_02985 [Nitrososphaeraceae archaeon]|jgi:hypothetical protein|nr:hypothetical protein [Nitrososphaeraceae archaeon]